MKVSPITTAGTHTQEVSEDALPGRKRDVLDCQWLQQLMRYGLLRGAFRPADEVWAPRAVWRHRDMLPGYQPEHVQHLQKALIPDERATTLLRRRHHKPD